MTLTLSHSGHAPLPSSHLGCSAIFPLGNVTEELRVRGPLTPKGYLSQLRVRGRAVRFGDELAHVLDGLDPIG